MKPLLAAFLALLVSIPLIARAQAIDADLDREAKAALDALYAGSQAARVLAATAKGVLVFPDVRTSSLVEGAPAGDGVMFSDGKIAGYYGIGGLAADMEAGAQSYSYVMFFMSDVAFQRLNDPGGFDIGGDPNIVIFDVASAVMIGGASLRGQTITQLDR